MSPYVGIWVVFAAAVIVIAIYRQAVAHKDDENLHVVGSASELIEEQTKASMKIGKLDRLGQSLTVVTVAYGLVLAVIYLLRIWHQGAGIQP